MHRTLAPAIDGHFTEVVKTHAPASLHAVAPPIETVLKQVTRSF
jgi:hypothetical protein